MMRPHIALLSAALLILFSSTAWPQASSMDPGESGGSASEPEYPPLPGLDDDDDRGIGIVPISLRLRLDQLTEDAEHFAVYCGLNSRLLGSDETIAEGYLYVTRDEGALRDFYRTMGFDGFRDDDIVSFSDKVEIVPPHNRRELRILAPLATWENGAMTGWDRAARTGLRVLVDGEPALYDSPTILVGGQETYEARCRHCHSVPRVDQHQGKLL